MGSLGKTSIGGSIHRIREFELEKVNLVDEFDILQIVGEGWFGKILLVEHKATDTEMVLKALPKPYTALKDFYREFHYGLHLGAHRNIITTYDVSFETAGFYVFSQEYAPLGDLTSNVTDTGIGELHTKRVAKQLSAALEHLHTRDLVHRDVKLDNILVFKSDFSRIKLCDFGETRRAGTVVPRRNEWLPYAPPEVLEISTDNSYKALTSHDVWQFGIVIFVCLTGCLPWQKAANEDPRYSRYLSWHSSTMPLKKQPKLFKLITSKAQKLFKKYLDPKPEKRPAGLAEVHRYVEDRWMSKTGIEKTMETPSEEEGLCPSMYSFHSSPEEKNKLLYSLSQCGLETTVDRKAKKDRIRQWIQSSVIEEEEEEQGEEIESEEDIRIKDNQTGPIGERMVDRGPVAHTIMAENGIPRKPLKKYASTLSLRKEPEVYKPPIDPRIPLELQRTQSAAQINSVPKKSEMVPNFNTSVVNGHAYNSYKNSSSDSNGKQNGSIDKIYKKLKNTDGIIGTSIQILKSNSVDKKSESTSSGSEFSIKNALPFQNMHINGTANPDNKIDNNNTIEHKINVQMSQSEVYDIYFPLDAQPNKGVSNGQHQRMFKTVTTSPNSRKKTYNEDKRYGAYNGTPQKNNTGIKAPARRSNKR